MIQHYQILCLFLLFTLSLTAQHAGNKYDKAHEKYDDATCPIPPGDVQHFVYFAKDRSALRGHPLLEHPRFAGAQIMYSWRELETARDRYDFSTIRKDLAYLKKHGKKLFIQLQDATFYAKYDAVPRYLKSEEFGGGQAAQYNDAGRQEGWVAKRWDPRVQARFARFLQALGAEFDGEVAGVNLQETAIGVDATNDASFTSRKYLVGYKANMLALTNAFPQSDKMIYANFFPGEWLPWEDEGYLRELYRYGEEIGVGFGGPDLLFERRAQLNHILRLMHEGDYAVPLGIAIQDGNYVAKTGVGKDVDEADPSALQRRNIVPKLFHFANDFLRVDYMFWGNQQPYFSALVLPCFAGG
ncbi:MAG: hypothetical protein AAFZ52_14485 [Bacteroidota bacterium]